MCARDKVCVRGCKSRGQVALVPASGVFFLFEALSSVRLSEAAVVAARAAAAALAAEVAVAAAAAALAAEAAVAAAAAAVAAVRAGGGAATALGASTGGFGGWSKISTVVCRLAE